MKKTAAQHWASYPAKLRRVIELSLHSEAASMALADSYGYTQVDRTPAEELAVRILQEAARSGRFLNKLDKMEAAIPIRKF